VASLTEPLAVSLRGITLGDPQPDSRVLVLGAGTIGLCAALVARDRAASVAITARHPHQRAVAESLGVTVLAEGEASAWAKEHRPDVVVESVGGSADTVAEAVRVTRRGGRIVLLGAFSEPKALDLSRFMMKELSLLGSFCYGTSRRGPTSPLPPGSSVAGGTELARMATHQFPLDRVADAFTTASDKSSAAIKVTVTP
jgi:threonine dehydrogenase-like Zn-dependent dehydrogenase